ncbi:hypothetical protein BCR39DRAFT_520364 [Naematelia encephala]|uniref:Zn(2)-C6 fungal-type domain-containing protein n=1 Tax=Naematelia encephala TaxID=71784 RepID=A0A1Y2BF79_9TREE|nr:hypothetical protein BCR39DRAFT_520364 [Naematelia encephala]
MAEDRSDTEDASVENQIPAGKRKRVVLSCLNCKKRKVKCDKQLPCINCRERREIHLCRYGSTPPASESYVKLSLFTTLQDRVRQIEQHIFRSVSTDTVTPSSLTSVRPSTTKDETHTSKSESAFLALDDLSNVTNDPDETHGMRLFHKPPRPRAQQPSGVWPNIVGQIPVNERPDRWIGAMKDNLAALPDRPVMEHLVDHYFSTVDLFWHHVHQSVFREEFSQFLSIRDSGQPLLVDPAWIALLTSVLCVSTHSLLRCGWTNGLATLNDTHRDFYNSLSKQLDEAFENVLLCAGCLRRPQFRVLQALLIILNINQMDRPMSSFDGVLCEPTASLWLDTAISICQGLRLHMLGPQYERDTPPDPAFPSGQTLYAQEMASRATHALAFWDQIICCLEMDERGGDQWAFRFPTGGCKKTIDDY